MKTLCSFLQDVKEKLRWLILHVSITVISIMITLFRSILYDPLLFKRRFAHWKILTRYPLATRSWSQIENESVQKLQANTRYGHSVALYDDSMFIYGGTSERFFIMEDLLEFKFGT